MKIRNFAFICIAGMVLHAAPINIVTTTTDLASIARHVAGDLATVESISSGKEDPHDLTARPSFITKASVADLWIRIGLELEVGWEPPVLRDSKNRRIQVGMPGHLDASEMIERLDVPSGEISRADGDIHPSGNPHYWLDPLNGRIIAKCIADRLIQLYPDKAEIFKKNLRDFEHRLDAKMFGPELIGKVSGAKLWWLCNSGKLDAFLSEKGLRADEGSWYAMMAPYKNAPVATYHRSWIYLFRRFNLTLAGEIEPKPGIPPSARHLAAISRDFKEKGVKVILEEPFYNIRAAEKLSQSCGAVVVVRANCTGGAENVDDYLEMLDEVISGLSDALGR